MRSISLTQGKFALVSDEDFEYLSIWNWFAEKDSGGNFRAYRYQKIKASTKYKKTPMSRAIMAFDLFMCGEKREVDHVDRNTLNNCRSNLRIATRTQNMANQKIKMGGSQKYKGVRKSSKGRWRVMLRGEIVCYCQTENRAANAYNWAALELYGDFAVLNEVA